MRSLIKGTGLTWEGACARGVGQTGIEGTVRIADVRGEGLVR
jgi:hypothetical protein